MSTKSEYLFTQHVQSTTFFASGKFTRTSAASTQDAHVIVSVKSNYYEKKTYTIFYRQCLCNELKCRKLGVNV